MKEQFPKPKVESEEAKVEKEENSIEKIKDEFFKKIDQLKDKKERMGGWSSDPSFIDFLDQEEFVADIFEDKGNYYHASFIQSFNTGDFILDIPKEYIAEIKEENMDIGWNFESFQDVKIIKLTKKLEDYTEEFSEIKKERMEEDNWNFNSVHYDGDVFIINSEDSKEEVRFDTIHNGLHHISFNLNGKEQLFVRTPGNTYKNLQDISRLLSDDEKRKINHINSADTGFVNYNIKE